MTDWSSRGLLSEVHVDCHDSDCAVFSRQPSLPLPATIADLPASIRPSLFVKRIVKLMPKNVGDPAFHIGGFFCLRETTDAPGFPDGRSPRRVRPASTLQQFQSHSLSLRRRLLIFPDWPNPSLFTVMLTRQARRMAKSMVVYFIFTPSDGACSARIAKAFPGIACPAHLFFVLGKRYF